MFLYLILNKTQIDFYKT